MVDRAIYLKKGFDHRIVNLPKELERKAKAKIKKGIESK